MHWLSWQEVWHFVLSWQGAAAAFVAALATFYYGPRKMLETWDWYLDRFVHSKIREFLHASVKAYRTQQGETMCGELRTVEEISKATKLSNKRVLKSLSALQKKKEAIEEDGKWRTPNRLKV